MPGAKQSCDDENKVMELRKWISMTKYYKFKHKGMVPHGNSHSFLLVRAPVEDFEKHPSRSVVLNLPNAMIL